MIVTSSQLPKIMTCIPYSNVYFWFSSWGSSINDVTPKFQFFDPPPSPCHPTSPLTQQPLRGDIIPGSTPPSPSILMYIPLFSKINPKFT